MTSNPFPRPDPLMPEIESEAVRRAYSDATVILEYGCGGSTMMAAEMQGKTVFSVESDQEWVEMTREWLEENPPAEGTHIDLNWIDIGPTREWGHPKNHGGWRRYANYPLQIWEKENFRQPDVVLVDGRFRIGCALATAFRTQKRVTLLFDDYADRKQYRQIETFVDKPILIGRMAIFEINPTPIPADRLADVIRLMTQP